MRGRYFLFLMRFMIGVVYIISGAEKLLQPYENFLYIVQEYDIVPSVTVEYAVAWLFPWLELFLGGFLLLGLWTRESLIVVGLFSMVFIVAVGQAIIRELPLAECGCFGDLVGMPLTVTLIIDILILSLVILLLRFYDRGTLLWALDRCWIEKKEQYETETH
ncbi:MAG: DoxX family membrane protein [Candidatus Omnitrophica bacterium]|nr:DoxX family membrane protein [Candidatus Omnitrophota bacterium]